MSVVPWVDPPDDEVVSVEGNEDPNCSFPNIGEPDDIEMMLFSGGEMMENEHGVFNAIRFTNRDKSIFSNYEYLNKELISELCFKVLKLDMNQSIDLWYRRLTSDPEVMHKRENTMATHTWIADKIN